jgi:transcriptional regulator with XRE-family HTH domain
MAEPRRGRPPNPVDPEASHAARLGAEIRTRRTTEGLTLQQLVDLVGYTPQYLSEVERAKTTPTVAFVAAVDRALNARGALEGYYPQSSKIASDSAKIAPKPVEPKPDRRYAVTRQRTAK